MEHGVSGQMEQVSMETCRVARNMAEVVLCGRVEHGMKANLSMISLRAEDACDGPMAPSMRGVGKAVVCMALGASSGQMAARMKESTGMMREMDMECSDGPMEDCTKENS